MLLNTYVFVNTYVLAQGLVVALPPWALARAPTELSELDSHFQTGL